MAEITDADRELATLLSYAVRDAEGMTARSEARVAIAQALADQRAELEAAFDAAYEGLRAQYEGRIFRVMAEIGKAENWIRASTPPITAERLIAEGEIPKVSTGALRAALEG